MADNNRFGGVIQLENLTFDIALSIRQAQVYGISVQRFGADDFSLAYGMHFDVSDPQHYELFADVLGTGIFDPNPALGENIPPSPYTIRSGFVISGLCVPEGSDAATCLGTNAASQLDIVFKRPEADAYIRKNGESSLHESARIVLSSPRGDSMSILVESNGQISVRRNGQ